MAELTAPPVSIEDLIDRWDSGDGKPYKGSLIDLASYRADPTNPGCMCAQGQVLHYVGGVSHDDLRDMDQLQADRDSAKLLNISVAHAVLLRTVNDSVDGAPSVVLTAPGKVIGDQAETILAFWRHIDRMTADQWAAAGAAAGDAAGAAAWVAAGAAAGDAAWVAAGDAAWVAAGDAAGDAAWDAARAAARAAAWAAARAAAQYATAEIMGARILREQGQPFFFLPMFGFADPEAVLAADAQVQA